jgi:(R,R)-butanediol dehydrogenase/meso-butanediol dehydrogenase/diacetyl reductase
MNRRNASPVAATMRAARWHGRGDVRVESVPVPKPGETEVLVAIERVGLCGTDLEEYRDGPIDIASGPVTLGHELVGTIAAAPGATIPIGTRVIPDVVRGCGHCWWCRRHEPGLCPDLVVLGLQDDGGLAEYMAASAATCVIVPDGVDADRAAFAEPTSVAVRAVRKAGDLAGGSLAVIGCGTIGLLTAQVAAAAGASFVIGIDPLAVRRDLAAAGGALVASPEEAGRIVAGTTHGRGADVVVECSGTRAGLTAAVALSRRGGVVVVVGTGAPAMEIAIRAIVLGERRLVGSAAHVFDEDVAAAVALIANGIVDPRPLLTDVVALEDVVSRGLARLAQDHSATKILIAP